MATIAQGIDQGAPNDIACLVAIALAAADNHQGALRQARRHRAVPCTPGPGKATAAYDEGSAAGSSGARADVAGGAAQEAIAGVRVDGRGRVYVAECTGFPVLLPAGTDGGDGEDWYVPNYEGHAVVFY